MINTLVCDITGWAEEIHCVGELPYLYKEEEESNNIVNANLIEFGYNYMNQPTDGNFGSFDVEECVLSPGSSCSRMLSAPSLVRRGRSQ